MKLVFSLSILLLFSLSAFAQEPTGKNLLDELNPFDPSVEQQLESYDQWYEDGTGLSAHLPTGPDFQALAGCRRASCPIWARVEKSEQRLYLYVNGSPYAAWSVSTGRPRFTTPHFDRHPDGRIYDRYSSVKYPGGDYNGMGNMPYAVFISGGFAIHGTGQSNWPHLGHPVSHGCIRLYPDYAHTFNRMVRAKGVSNVWITVE
jgi:hypothetical protein